MSVTIVDANGKQFTVTQPFSVLSEPPKPTYLAGDCVRVRIDNAMISSDDEDDDVVEDDYGYAIVITPSNGKKIKVAWMYSFDELVRQVKKYDFYLTDHVDTIFESTITGTVALPHATAPTVLTNPGNRLKCKLTNLPVHLCAACIVTADWVSRNGVENVFIDGPGHAEHYREEWKEFDEEKKAAALHLARSTYKMAPLDFAKLALHVQWFDTLC